MLCDCREVQGVESGAENLKKYNNEPLVYLLPLFLRPDIWLLPPALTCPDPPCLPSPAQPDGPTSALCRLVHRPNSL